MSKSTTRAGLTVLALLVVLAIVAILVATMTGRAHAQATITSYFASPQQPNGGVVDTNDFPLTITNGGMTIIPQSTNTPNNVFVLRQNVGLGLFINLTVTNANTATTNGYVLLWLDFSGDGTSNTITGETNGVWDGQIQHGALFQAWYTAMPESTDTFVLWTNLPNTIVNNVRDVRISAASNSLPTGVRVNGLTLSQSWQ